MRHTKRNKLELNVETLRALIARELEAIAGGGGSGGTGCTSGARDCPTYPHVTCPSYRDTECDLKCAYRPR